MILNLLTFLDRYNSAIFQSLSRETYTAFVVSEDFLTGGTWTQPDYLLTMYGGPWDQSAYPLPKHSSEPGIEVHPGSVYDVDNIRDAVTQMQRLVGRLERLENKACIQAYGKDIVSDRKNLLAVTSEPTFRNNTVLASLSSGSRSYPYESYWWLCSSGFSFDTCDVDQLLASTSSWSLSYYPIKYCLSQQVDERCRLQFSLPILVVVVICNLIKLVCMAFTLFGGKDEPLITIGDAIASFLDDPDSTTHGRCLSSKEDFVSGTWAWEALGQSGHAHMSKRLHTWRLSAWPWKSSTKWQHDPGIWQPTHERWFRAPSLKQWISTMTLWVLPPPLLWGIYYERCVDSDLEIDLRLIQMYSCSGHHRIPSLPWVTWAPMGVETSGHRLTMEDGTRFRELIFCSRNNANHTHLVHPPRQHSSTGSLIALYRL